MLSLCKALTACFTWNQCHISLTLLYYYYILQDDNACPHAEHIVTDMTIKCWINQSEHVCTCIIPHIISNSVHASLHQTIYIIDVVLGSNYPPNTLTMSDNR